MTDRQPSDGPPYFGMPESSPFTIEGRIERAEAAATHATRVRDGRERRVWRSDFRPGLVEIGAAFGLLLVVLVLLYLLG